MNYKHFSIVGLLCIFLMLSSCGTTKSIQGESAKEMKTAQLLKSIQAQKPQFVHLSIQTKINADIDNNSVGLNGKIYVRDGKMIWVNISKFGITAARAKITPEGFQAFEKLGQTYIDGDFSYFNNLLKVDFIDYAKLQNLLLGRIFVDLNPKDFEAEVLDGQYVVSAVDNAQLEKKPKEGRYIQTYIFDGSFRLQQAYLKDPKSGMELDINYESWTQFGVQQFPKSVKILVKDKKTQRVALEYNNFTFEKSETPFSIPSSYQPNKIMR